MRLFPLLLTLTVAPLFIESNDLIAQVQRAEFIESSSPLPSGEQVVSRSAPGRGIQTVILSPSGSSAIDNPQSVLSQNPAASQETALRQTPQILPSTVIPSAANTTYQYPVGNQLAPSFVLYPPVRASATQNQPVPYQMPTLGLSNTLTARRTQFRSNCGCNSQSLRRIPVAQGPVIQIQPPASQIPTLAIPNQNPAVTTVNSIASVGAPQNAWNSPISSETGVYQPVIRLANLPPGTFVGQGILGQPKAYVDGQPIRNLMRYVFP